MAWPRAVVVTNFTAEVQIAVFGALLRVALFILSIKCIKLHLLLSLPSFHSSLSPSTPLLNQGIYTGTGGTLSENSPLKMCHVVQVHAFQLPMAIIQKDVGYYSSCEASLGMEAAHS